MNIIGLAGKKQSGKDTVYQIASELLEAPVGRIAFADPLKLEVSEITGFRVDFIEEHKQDFRTLLQVWGTDFRRKFCGSDYWIEQMDSALDKAAGNYKNIFITDVRFPNEADFIKNKGGRLIKIERRNMTYQNIQEAVDHDRHPTETEMEDYHSVDYVLNNDGTEKELHKSVANMLSTLKMTENAA
jgi:hypothetical protein